ncbi:MAG: hypothetical protein M3R14_11955 [Acidobacteriota bacterium]|nr:hypothetical protein [Acidobacteriota bacterium]
MLQIKFSKTIICLLFLTLVLSASAQTKRKPAKKKTAKETTLTKTQPVAENDAIPVVKKNARPESESQTPPIKQTDDKVKTAVHPAAADGKSVYFYEFSKSDFFISKIYIEHDDNGKGKITFQKKDFAEPVTDPIQLSAAALERIKTTWQALNFLDSAENYQYEKDFSNLGTMKFTMKKDGRMREAKFNWTENKNAKTLADEYRRIGQQFIWIFDITVARENQPLESPKLLDSLDSLIRRNEISDAVQMIPLLNELSNDERIPLIARNHATKLIKQIEKRKENEK